MINILSGLQEKNSEKAPNMKQTFVLCNDSDKPGNIPLTNLPQTEKAKTFPFFSSSGNSKTVLYGSQSYHCLCLCVLHNLCSL
jgi:hypothetical protein